MFLSNKNIFFAIRKKYIIRNINIQQTLICLLLHYAQTNILKIFKSKVLKIV